VERNSLRNSELLKKLAMYLIFNMSNSIVITRIAEKLNNNRTTILHLIETLEEAYLVYPMTCYLFSVHGGLVSTKARKIYCVDNGLFTALKTNDKGDAIKRMRNAIFKQLHFDWEEKVYFWRNGLEMDFVVSDGFSISVATTQKETDKRITKTLYYLQSHNLQRGIVINQDKLHLVEEGNQTVLLLPFWIFMGKSKENILAAFES
jgi:predicted AAA+ superfamily ATPase